MDVQVAAEDELSTSEKAPINPPSSSHAPANLETISSKEEMKIASGNRPDPYQLGYFLLGRSCPACAGQPSMMSSVEAY
jgi:hypothetical protein